MSRPDAREVGRLIANDWASDCEENTPDELRAAVKEFANRLASQVEIIHGDAEALAVIEGFREAADHAERLFGERIRTGVELRRKAR